MNWRSVLSALAVVGLATGSAFGVVGGLVSDVPNLDAATSPTDVEIPPADRILSCPGTPLPQAVGAANATRESWTVTESSVGALTEVIPIGDRGAVSQAPSRREVTGRAPLGIVAAAPTSPTGESFTVIGHMPDAEPGQPGAEPAAAVASWNEAGDLRGLTASQCRTPAADHWIVAGDTSPGSTTTLVVDNPGLTTVVATVTLWGTGGTIGAEGGEMLAIAPGSTETLSLGAAAPGERRLVAHVTTDGGYVAAAITQSNLDGIVPLGVDRAPAGSGPGLSQVVPAVVVDGRDIGDDRAAVLRLLATETDTTAQVRLLRADGIVPLRGAQEVALVAGEVMDVSLGGVPAGTYAVVVTAESLIVAAAKSVRQGDTASSAEGSLSIDVGTNGDFAWVQSAGSATTALDEVLPLPQGVSGQISVIRTPSSHSELRVDMDTLAIVDAGAPVASDEELESDSGSGTAAAIALHLTAYNSAGDEVGTSTAPLARSRPTVVDLAAAFPGQQIAAVRVTAPDVPAGDQLALGLIAQVPDLAGSIAVMQPEAREESAVTVGVVRGPMG